MTCSEVEERLPAYIDGESPDAVITAHLDACPACSASAHKQSIARTILRTRAADLASVAPLGLRNRLIANLPQDFKGSRPQDLGWSARLSAFAAAAMVVLAIGAVLLPFATVRSTALLAAQLALDHLKCFTIDGDAEAEPVAKADAEATLQHDYGFSAAVPASAPAERLELLAVRRCLYGDGLAAHLLYRVHGEPVSLFIIPGLTRPAAELSLFGHDEVVWTQGDRTYMLVAGGGLRNDLSRVASYLRSEAK
jgi:anti-sigma factor RsiW